MRSWKRSRPGGQADLDELLKVERFTDPVLAARRSAMWPDSPRTECVLHFGHEPHSSRHPFRRTMIDGLQRWVASIGPQENCVWLDNSTIMAATTLLWDRQGARLFTPLTLWDLATFVRAAICFERIYHLEHPAVRDSTINRLLGAEVLIPVPADMNNGVERVLNEIWSDVDSRILDLYNRVGTQTLDGQLVEALVQGWQKITRNPSLRAQDLLDVDSADKHWPSPGYERLRSIATYHGAFSRFDRAETITDENYRTMVNQRIADLMGLPYLPAVTRVPFRGLLNERKQAISSRLYAARILDGAYAELAGGQTLPLPAFLAVAVRRSGRTLHGIWAAVAELRSQGKRFRSRRAELDWALASRDKRAVTEVSHALSIDAQRFSELVGDVTVQITTSVVERVTDGDVDQVSLGLSVLEASARSALSSAMLRTAVLRWTRPHLYFLTRIRQESEQIVDAMPYVAEIWQIPEREQDDFVAHAREISKLAWT